MGLQRNKSNPNDTIHNILSRIFDSQDELPQYCGQWSMTLHKNKTEGRCKSMVSAAARLRVSEMNAESARDTIAVTEIGGKVVQ
jgi:hypothetical protein